MTGSAPCYENGDNDNDGAGSAEYKEKRHFMVDVTWEKEEHLQALKL